MGSWIFIGFLGILLINQALGLEMNQEVNSLAGAYFSHVGDYEFVDSIDETLLTSYTLTNLENALSNAKKYGLNFEKEILGLEENLNKIYKICNKNRKNDLPFGTLKIQESELKHEVEMAVNESMLILSDLNSLVSKKFKKKFDIDSKMNMNNKSKDSQSEDSRSENNLYSRYNRYDEDLPSKNYLYPEHISDIEVAKKYIKITFDLKKFSRNVAVIDVKMAVPALVQGELKRIFYVPMKTPQSQEFAYLKDRSINNLVVLKSALKYGSSSYVGYYNIKNLDSCELINKMFLCDPSLMIKVLYSQDSCITSIYQSDCRSFYDYYCRKTIEKCGYESYPTHNEFTKLFDNKSFALLTRKANYIYICEDGRREQGVLEFNSYGNNKFTGTVDVAENCSLITAYSSVINKGGVLEILSVNNKDLIWADTPKIIGIRIWIFAVSVALLSLIVLIALITWIWICIRHYKANKKLKLDSLIVHN